MKPASREKNWLEHRPGLMLAAVFVCVLLHSGSAFGSSVSRGHGFDVDEHSQHCKCRTKCRGSSCCCGPVGTTVRNSASDSVSEGSDADAGPCLNSAPCGDSGLPSAPSFNQHAKIATLSMTRREHPETCERFIAISSSCTLPARRACRIDKPPRV